jgi:hypothetical protein
LLTQRREIEIPLEYLKFISYVNGLRAFSISLAGLHESRRDIVHSNENICDGAYKVVPRDLVYIGSRHYNAQDNVGYFMNDSGTVTGYLQTNGTKLKSWPSLWDLFSEELEPEEERMKEGGSK